MKYYSIHESINIKIIGKYPQTKEIHYNCHVWDDPKFVGHVSFEKVNFEPITANAILYPKSKQTDLINANSAMGFSNKLLISGKLKNLLKKNRTTGMQFFKSPIIQNNLIVEDYWVLNMYVFNNDYVDFSKSRIIYNKKDNEYKINFKTSKEVVNFENFTQFELERMRLWSSREELISIENLILNNKIIKEDFFMINYVFGSLFFISEKFKKEIEDAGCTGIEFQPTELSYNDWLMPGGEREKTYGKM